MNIFTAENLSKSFSEQPVFSGISLSLGEVQKAALIGANGCGKSTLLKIIAGRETAETGSVASRKGTRIGYLDQEPALDDSKTIIENILSSDDEVSKAIREYEKYYNAGLADEKLLHRITEKMDHLGAWTYEASVKEILGKLGIHDLNVEARNLSGGQRKRIALAHFLVQQPDLLLLDEPTNHLDLDMIEWLENFLRQLNKSMLIVTHDRYFLDSVCNTIYEMDRGKLFSYSGNYSYFLEKKHERIMREKSEAGKAQNLLRRELAWMRRQPKARGTKQKARIDSFYTLEEKAKLKLPDEKNKISMQTSRMGSKILELHNVCKSYSGKKLFENFSHTFKRGEKAGIIGRNGSGKSTLLNIIMGRVKPDAGKVRSGETIVYGYYTQEGITVPGEKKIIDVIRDIAEYVETGNGNYINASQFLEHFGFDRSKQQTQVEKLSGGEKRKLYLLTILVKSPNFLILDEPTNDLDIETLNLLEDFVAGFEGCLLVVTHDRYFLDKLVDHVFVLDGSGTVRDIHGNYTDYRESIKRAGMMLEKTPTTAPRGSKRERTKSKQKLSFNEQRELTQIENEIESLEKEKEEIILSLNEGKGVHEQLKEWSQRLDEVMKLLDEKTNRWLELSERV